jgi:hypothetical protein
VLAQIGAHLAQLEHALHADHELGRPHRLGEEVIAADPQRTVERVDVALRGQKHDRRLGAAGPRPDLLAHRNAVHARHLHVEQDAVRRFALERDQRLRPAVGEHDRIALTLQRGARHRAADLVVVDDEDLRGRYRGVLHAWFAQDTHLCSRHPRILRTRNQDFDRAVRAGS